MPVLCGKQRFRCNLLGTDFFFSQVELYALDPQKIWICYRTCSLAEIEAANPSVRPSGSLEQTKLASSTFKKSEKRIKTQTLIINTDSKERLTVGNGKPFPFKYRQGVTIVLLINGLRYMEKHLPICLSTQIYVILLTTSKFTVTQGWKRPLRWWKLMLCYLKQLWWVILLWSDQNPLKN